MQVSQAKEPQVNALHLVHRPRLRFDPGMNTHISPQ